MKTTEVEKNIGASFSRKKNCMQTEYVDQDISDVLIGICALERKIA